MKRCCGCGIVKPYSEFYGNKGRPDGLQSRCKDCAKLDRKKWYRSNLDRALSYAASYRDAHRAAMNESARNYARQHREEKRASWAAYSAQHRQELRDKGRERYNRDRERMQGYSRAWKESHKDEAKAYAKAYWAAHPERRRQKLAAKNGGTFTLDEWVALCKKYDDRCLCCWEKKPLTVDHVVPLADGGRNDIQNIQPLCHNCNCRKSKKTIDYRISRDEVQAGQLEITEC